MPPPAGPTPPSPHGGSRRPTRFPPSRKAPWPLPDAPLRLDRPTVGEPSARTRGSSSALPLSAPPHGRRGRDRQAGPPQERLLFLLPAVKPRDRPPSAFPARDL